MPPSKPRHAAPVHRRSARPPRPRRLVSEGRRPYRGAADAAARPAAQPACVRSKARGRGSALCARRGGVPAAAGGLAPECAEAAHRAASGHLRGRRQTGHAGHGAELLARHAGARHARRAVRPRCGSGGRRGARARRRLAPPSPAPAAAPDDARARSLPGAATAPPAEAPPAAPTCGQGTHRVQLYVQIYDEASRVAPAAGVVRELQAEFGDALAIAPIEDVTRAAQLRGERQPRPVAAADADRAQPGDKACASDIADLRACRCRRVRARDASVWVRDLPHSSRSQGVIELWIPPREGGGKAGGRVAGEAERRRPAIGQSGAISGGPHAVAVEHAQDFAAAVGELLADPLICASSSSVRGAVRAHLGERGVVEHDVGRRLRARRAQSARLQARRSADRPASSSGSGGGARRRGTHRRAEPAAWARRRRAAAAGPHRAAPCACARVGSSVLYSPGAQVAERDQLAQHGAPLVSDRSAPMPNVDRSARGGARPCRSSCRAGRRSGARRRSAGRRCWWKRRMHDNAFARGPVASHVGGVLAVVARFCRAGSRAGSPRRSTRAAARAGSRGPRREASSASSFVKGRA